MAMENGPRISLLKMGFIFQPAMLVYRSLVAINNQVDLLLAEASFVKDIVQRIRLGAPARGDCPGPFFLWKAE